MAGSPERRTEIYLTRFPDAGPRVQVTAAGGAHPVWSRDGRRLFYISAGNELHAVDVDVSGGPDIGPPHVLLRDDVGTRMFDQSLVGFDVGPDGTIAGLRYPQEPFQPIHFVTDWRTLPGRE